MNTIQHWQIFLSTGHIFSVMFSRVTDTDRGAHRETAATDREKH